MNGYQIFAVFLTAMAVLCTPRASMADEQSTIPVEFQLVAPQSEDHLFDIRGIKARWRDEKLLKRVDQYEIQSIEDRVLDGRSTQLATLAPKVSKVVIQDGRIFSKVHAYHLTYGKAQREFATGETRIYQTQDHLEFHYMPLAIPRADCGECQIKFITDKSRQSGVFLHDVSQDRMHVQVTSEIKHPDPETTGLPYAPSLYRYQILTLESQALDQDVNLWAQWHQWLKLDDRGWIHVPGYLPAPVYVTPGGQLTWLSARDQYMPFGTFPNRDLRRFIHVNATSGKAEPPPLTYKIRFRHADQDFALAEGRSGDPLEIHRLYTAVIDYAEKHRLNPQATIHEFEQSVQIDVSLAPELHHRYRLRSSSRELKDQLFRTRNESHLNIEFEAVPQQYDLRLKFSHSVPNAVTVASASESTHDFNPQTAKWVAVDADKLEQAFSFHPKNSSLIVNASELPLTTRWLRISAVGYHDRFFKLESESAQHTVSPSGARTAEITFQLQGILLQLPAHPVLPPRPQIRLTSGVGAERATTVITDGVSIQQSKDRQIVIVPLPENRSWHALNEGLLELWAAGIRPVMVTLYQQETAVSTLERDQGRATRVILVINYAAFASATDAMDDVIEQVQDKFSAEFSDILRRYENSPLLERSFERILTSADRVPVWRELGNPKQGLAKSPQRHSASREVLGQYLEDLLMDAAVGDHSRICVLLVTPFQPKREALASAKWLDQRIQQREVHIIPIVIGQDTDLNLKLKSEIYRAMQIKPFLIHDINPDLDRRIKNVVKDCWTEIVHLSVPPDAPK